MIGFPFQWIENDTARARRRTENSRPQCGPHCYAATGCKISVLPLILIAAVPSAAPLPKGYARLCVFISYLLANLVILVRTAGLCGLQIHAASSRGIADTFPLTEKKIEASCEFMQPIEATAAFLLLALCSARIVWAP